ncbi:MAG TPA: glycosyltransferase [candidate division Zixibacteria bacterium]|nr:glycosyltransferase [candidate division Zixibacteria bacterium]
MDFYYVIPELPSFLIKKIFPFNWSGLCFHPRHLRINEKRLFNPDKMFKLDSCRAVAVLDEGIKDKLAVRINDKPVIAFPDITNDSVGEVDNAIVIRMKKKAKGRKIIGLVGNLTKHKGLLALLEVSERTQDRNWFYVFAGPLDKSTFTTPELQQIQLTVESGQENCFFYFEYLRDGREYNSLIDALDVLFAAHKNFPHSSNTLTKAAIFKKPVVVSDGYCMAERVKKYNLGEIISNHDPISYINAFERLLETNEVHGNPKNKRQFQEYSKLHSVNSLKRSFEELLLHY